MKDHEYIYDNIMNAAKRSLLKAVPLDLPNILAKVVKHHGRYRCRVAGTFSDVMVSYSSKYASSSDKKEWMGIWDMDSVSTLPSDIAMRPSRRICTLVSETKGDDGREYSSLLLMEVPREGVELTFDGWAEANGSMVVSKDLGDPDNSDMDMMDISLPSTGSIFGLLCILESLGYEGDVADG